MWTAYRLGLSEALKAYFGRLVIAQSTLDDFLVLHAEHETRSGGEVLSLGFQGDQPVRTLHTAEDTERSLSTVEDLLAKIQLHFEVLPVDGAEDLRLDEAGSFEVDEFLDPVHLVRQHGLYLLSDDGHPRQLARAYGAPRGGWLQVVCRMLALSRITTETAYLIAVAQLAALRHAHLWLDATILHGLDRLDDPRRDGLFQAAARYIGGLTADMTSHTIVVANFMRHAYI